MEEKSLNLFILLPPLTTRDGDDDGQLWYVYIYIIICFN